MTKLDKMRQKQAAKTPGQQAAPEKPRTSPELDKALGILLKPQEPAENLAKAKKPPAEKVVVGYEPVARACGHVQPFKLYADPDTYRDARRQKHADQKCGDCRVKDHNTEQEARAAQKRASADDGRLPDGSSFTPAPVYDATAKQWSGGLRIGKEGEGGPTFETTASGVMGLFRALDLQYRTFLRREAKDTTEEAP